MSDRGRGGRIPPDGRPPQAKGVGKNTKRHDLERPATPGLHDSDLQQGDVQALEQGQRIAPKKTMTPAGPQAADGGSSPRSAGGGDLMPPTDPIDFLAKVNGGKFGPPQRRPQLANHAALNWLPIVRSLVTGPGSSPQLASTFINQVRNLSQLGVAPAAMVDLGAVDLALEAMLDEADLDNPGV